MGARFRVGERHCGRTIGAGTGTGTGTGLCCKPRRLPPKRYCDILTCASYCCRLNTEHHDAYISTYHERPRTKTFGAPRTTPITAAPSRDSHWPFERLCLSALSARSQHRVSPVSWTFAHMLTIPHNPQGAWSPTRSRCCQLTSRGFRLPWLRSACFLPWPSDPSRVFASSAGLFLPFPSSSSSPLAVSSVAGHLPFVFLYQDPKTQRPKIGGPPTATC